MPYIGDHQPAIGIKKFVVFHVCGHVKISPGGFGLGGLGSWGSVIGAAASSFKSNEASTTLLMIDNRSGVQLAAAEGSAKNFDFGLSGWGWTNGLTGSASGYANTPEGKIINVKVARGIDPVIDERAIDALRQYRFSPALLNGKPVHATWREEITFAPGPPSILELQRAAEEERQKEKEKEKERKRKP